jgi:hypothetical protein
MKQNKQNLITYLLIYCYRKYINWFVSQNQHMHKIIDKHKMYLQMNSHPQGVFIKELQYLLHPNTQ